MLLGHVRLLLLGRIRLLLVLLGLLVALRLVRLLIRLLGGLLVLRLEPRRQLRVHLNLRPAVVARAEEAVRERGRELCGTRGGGGCTVTVKQAGGGHELLPAAAHNYPNDDHNHHQHSDGYARDPPGGQRRALPRNAVGRLGGTTKRADALFGVGCKGVIIRPPPPSASRGSLS